MDLSGKATEEKYADIIHQERPGADIVCGSHPRMSNAERAKIFAPFEALRGHSDRLAVETGKLLRRNRIELSEEESQILSDKLCQVEKGMEIEAVYFIPDDPGSSLGCYTRIEGKVSSVDPVFRALRIGSTTIRFDDLIDVSGENIFEPLQWDSL